jgi:hypothetical protein
MCDDDDDDDDSDDDDSYVISFHTSGLTVR